MHTNIPYYPKNFPDKYTFFGLLLYSNIPSTTSSKGLQICKRSFLATCVSIMVVSGFECPDNSWI